MTVTTAEALAAVSGLDARGSMLIPQGTELLDAALFQMAHVRMETRHPRIAFTILFTGLSAWLGLQLVAPWLWP